MQNRESRVQRKKISLSALIKQNNQQNKYSWKSQIANPQTVTVVNTVQFSLTNTESSDATKFSVFKGLKIKLLKPLRNGNSIAAVIITIYDGGSYDHIFSTVQQHAEEGSQVLIYQCHSHSIKFVVDALVHGFTENDTLRKMLEHIKAVDPACVAFNWECCSSYEFQQFPQGKVNVFNLLRIIVQKGYMAMFSDFSLKALIKQWDESVLGPNPFVLVSTHKNNLQLLFDSNQLKRCSSPQLQTLGQICSSGKCVISTCPQTIVFGINHQKYKNNDYKLQILTLANILPFHERCCTLKNKRGMVGHAMLQYKTGAKLLVSMGHWIDLIKIQTTEQELINYVQKSEGAKLSQKLKKQFYQMKSQKDKYQQNLRMRSVEMVVKSPPCQKMDRFFSHQVQARNRQFDRDRQPFSDF